MKTLRMLGHFLRLKFRANMEYKGAFWAGTFAQVFSYGVDFLLIWILVSRFKSLAAWSSDEIIFLYAIKLMTYGIAGTFFFHSCTSLPLRIQSGSFDETLTQPMNPLLYEVLSNCSTGYIRHIGLSIVILVISFARMQIVLTPLKIFMLILFLLGGALIQSGLFLVFTAPNFWMIRGERLLGLFFFEISNFVQYPITIYPVFIQVILSFVLPYAFINFYPSQYFLDKNDFSVFDPFMQYLTPLVGVVVFAFGVWFWHWGIKKYQSTGS